MEELRKARRPARQDFDVLHKELESLLTEVPLKIDDIEVKYKLLFESYEWLLEHDGKILEQLVKENVSESDEDNEYAEIRQYKVRAETIRMKKEKLVPTVKPHESVIGGSVMEGKIRKFKLPTIQMKKFSGELKDWLGFWAQFQKIDEDPHMDGSDKFWYLLQSLEPGTDAHLMVSVYPQSNENYPKVIEALKKRFGNEDLLLQVYLRELLSLVIVNVKSKEKVPMKTLFLKLDSHLRALKSLKLEKADPATWLFPLVESSLPETVLYNWQHSPLSKHDGSNDDPPRTRLDMLMSFVEREVEIKQRIDITRTFAEQHNRQELEGRRGRDSRPEKRPTVPTMSSFHTADGGKCVFCDKGGHSSEDCYRAKSMSYEDKMSILRRKGLCFRCFGKHMIKDCKVKHIECRICRRPHPTILCKDFKSKKISGAPPVKKMRLEVPSETTTTTSSSNLECSGDVALQTLAVKIVNGNRQEIVRAFIDTGSQRSYILKDTAERLRLKPEGVERVIHSLFGGQRSSVVTHRRYEIDVRSVESDVNVKVEVREHNTICGGIPRVAEWNPEVVNELREKNVQLSDIGMRTSKIELLIGADMYPSVCTGGLLRLRCGAVALKTKLGWTLLGELATSFKSGNMSESMSVMDDCVATSLKSGNMSESMSVMDDCVATSLKSGNMSESMSVMDDCVATSFKGDNMSSMSMSVMDDCVAKLWELDVLGIESTNSYTTVETQEVEARTKFLSNICRLPEGRYSVKLPWKEGHECLPTNRPVAFKRLESATRKLGSSKMYEAYDGIFKEWLAEGFIERVPVTDYDKDCHYLPHRPVVKTSSLTTPVRPVFDASCRVGKSPSLNDCLVKGINLIQIIIDLIQRFREHDIGFVSDIRKAFQMIAVDLQDRDFMRFLWWKNADMKEVMELRHARVMFGATCSPFILAVVIEYHLENLPEEEKEIGKKILSSFYVDNCVNSEKTLEEYKYFQGKSIDIMKRAGMDLRMWLSNVEDLEDEATQTISVLGLLWNRKFDHLFVSVKGINIPEKVTKRVVLSTIQKLFDPIGFTSPAVLPMKVLLQKTWINKMKWDDVLPEGEIRSFNRWCEEAVKLGDIKIPRLSTNGVHDRNNWELHIFTDASKEAYAAVVFLRTQREERVNVQLLAAKSRVGPLKTLSIPKLELMGCLIGARLANAVKRALMISESEISETYWSDSSTALAWIRRDDQWGTFVANRTKEICNLTEVENWRHVPGRMNPADLPSRGSFPIALVASKWWEGPQWLHQERDFWPKPEESADESEIVKERRKSSEPKKVMSSLSVLTSIKAQHSFSSLVRIVGWVRRFLHNKLLSGVKKRDGSLSKRELCEAEIMLLKDIQRETFPPDQRHKLKGLELIEDDWGLLRVKTRLTYRNDPMCFKYPVLLPTQREEVKQLIRDFHRNYCHAGIGFLMTKIRQKYWIIKARKTIRGVVSKCYSCRKLSAKNVVPEAAPLPIDRIKNAEVFEVIGVDLAGPLILKNGNKTWLLIFTCAVYRAVHFEVVKSCSTRAFISALAKFIRKFRRPAIIYSDNGTNFHGADNLMGKLDWEAIQKEEGISPIKFKFNPPTAAWWGGWWERLIRTAKDLMKRTIGKKSLNYNELEAVVDSVAEVMNGRPLTYISENPNDLEPLTPSLFLNPLGNTNFPEAAMTEAETMRFRLNYVKTLKRELRERFLKEYLAYLVNRTPKKTTRKLREGELVLVGSDQRKRIDWPLGRVIQLIPGHDGEIRVAKVKTQTGELIRAVQRLFPLEMDADDIAEKAVREKGTTTRSGRKVKVPNKFM